MELQEFSFGNFRSFKEINTLNLSAAKLTSKDKKVDENNVFSIENQEGTSFLKSKAIYGANASGKSNIVKALVAFVRIINESFKDDEILRMIASFHLSSETEYEPTFFQIIFWEDQKKYRYGFEATNEEIYAEWLYVKSGKKELCYFIRDKDEIIELDKTNFAEGDKVNVLFQGDKENKLFRNNSLFLSSLASFGFGKISKKVVECVSAISIITGLVSDDMYHVAANSLENNETKKYILDFLNKGDIGIDDLKAVEIQKNHATQKTKMLLSSRKMYDKNLKFIGDKLFSFGDSESEGTQKLFELSPHIYKAFKENSVLVIDEFDARFHPLLTQKIVDLFNSEENKGAQLVVITHDTNLLSSKKMRRDQIAFVEKDKYGASHLYSLAEFKGVRNDASFEKDYIQGKYGAIPFLGNFENLID